MLYFSYLKITGLLFLLFFYFVAASFNTTIHAAMKLQFIQTNKDYVIICKHVFTVYSISKRETGYLLKPISNDDMYLLFGV